MLAELVSDKLNVLIQSKGAELLSVKNKEGLEFIWQANQDIWPRHAPVLFPIVGKLKNNVFTWKGKKFELGQHGFARDNEFRLIEQSGTSCTFEFISSPQTQTVYPFHFSLRIGYVLEGNRLNTTYTVSNTGEEDLLFSVGAHPGFNCPLTTGEKFEDYVLEFETEQLNLTELNEGLRRISKKEVNLPEKKLKLGKQVFDKDALVFENRQINAVTLRSEISDHQIKMECAGWPYFGIWSKKGCTEFVCLEPWYGIADSEKASGKLEDKEGIIRLARGKQFSCSFAISFS